MADILTVVACALVDADALIRLPLAAPPQPAGAPVAILPLDFD